MKKIEAKAALDSAVHDQVSRLFAVLCMGLNADPNPELVVDRFSKACEVLRKAHTLAVHHLVDKSDDDKIEPDH